MSDRTTEESVPQPGRGWETADKVAHGAGRVVNGVARVLVTLYAITLGIIGLFMLFHGSTWWAGLLAIAYAIYLVLPGRKIVVW